MAVYSVTITQIIDTVAEPAPDGENYSLETTFSSPEKDATPAPAPFGDGAFILVKIETLEADDIYQKICTYADVVRYLTDRADAVAAGDAYYRKLTWTKYFRSLEDVGGVSGLNTAAALQLTRTQYLCDDFAAYENTMPDTVVTVVTSA